MKLPDNDPRIIRLKEITKQVYDKGFNIHMMICKIKKQRKLIVDIPVEVIIRVCEEYLKHEKNIKNKYPWFLRVFAMESDKYFADQRIREGEAFKKMPISPGIKEIMRGMGR